MHQIFEGRTFWQVPQEAGKDPPNVKIFCTFSLFTYVKFIDKHKISLRTDESYLPPVRKKHGMSFFTLH
jgi:hypothetical protein